MNDLEDKINRIFGVANTRDNIPGFSIGILKNQESLFYSYGNSILSSHTQITEKTKFHIASISKYFTLLIFEILEKRKLVSRHDLVSRFIECNEQNNNLKIEHLIDHRSGLRDQWDLTHLAGWRPHDVITNEDIIALYKRQNQNNYLPKTHYSYCNTNYTLLANIIEQVSGEKIRELVKKFLRSNYQLNNTGYYDYLDDLPDFAIAYRKINGEYKKDIPNFCVTGSTSMYSTVSDLICFELENSKRSTDENGSIKQNKPVEIFYNNGLINYSSPHTQLFLHSGVDYGYSSMLFRFPNENLSIVILANAGIPKLLNKTLLICQIFAPNIIQEPLLRTITSKTEERVFDYQIAEGWYLNKESNNIFKVTNDKGFKIDGEDVLFFAERLGIISNTFTQIKIVDEVTLELIVNGDVMQYALIDQKESILNEDFFGEYYSKELDVHYRLSNVDQKLLLQGDRFQKYHVVKINNSYYKADGFTLKFFKDSSDNICFSLSSTRSWNIVFRKTEEN